MLVVTTLGTIAVVASVLVGAWNARTADDALAETRAEQRAWFGAPEIKLDGQPRGGAWGFEYTLKNVGKQPPHGTYFGAHLVPIHTADVSKTDEEAKRDCDAGVEVRAKHPTQYAEFSPVPGDALTLRDQVGNPAIRTSFRNADYSKDDLAHLHIIGCIVYTTDDGHVRHTKFSAPLDMSTGRPAVDPPYTLDPD